MADILKDATAVYFLLTVYEVVTGKDLPFVISPDDSVGEILASIRDRIKAERVPGTESNTIADFFYAGAGPGSPIGSLFAALGIDPLDTGVTE